MNRLIAGAAAGAIGGLAGAGVKALCEAIVPPRPPGRESPPGVLAAKFARAVAGRDLSDERKETVALAVHWMFSTVTSAIYGVVVANVDEPRVVNGVGFGLVIWTSLHEIALPVLGATPPLRRLPASEQVNEFVTHAVFGATVESVRAKVMQVMEGASLPRDASDAGAS